MPDEDIENHGDQQHAGDEDVDDRLDGRVDQDRAVVEGRQLHAGRQPALVQLLHLLVHALEHRQGLFPALQQHHAFDHIVPLVDADFSQPDPVPLAGLAEIAHEDRRTVLLGHDRVRDIVEIPHQSHAAHVEALRPHREIVATHIGIVLREPLNDLIQRDIEPQECAGIQIDVVFLGRAAIGADIDHAGHPLELPPDLPVLNGLQLGQALAGPGHFIAKDFGDGRPGRDRRLDVLGQRDGLQPVENFLPVAEIFRTEVEIDFDVAQAEDGEGADIGESRHTLERDLDRQGNGPFHLFGRPPAVLGDDFDHGGRRVRIGHHIQDMERVEPSEEQHKPGDTDEHALRQRKTDDFIDHECGYLSCRLYRSRRPGLNTGVRSSQTDQDVTVL